MEGGAQVYLRTQVQTQPPEKLVLMLFDGALRFMRQGREAMAARRYDQTSHCLVRAQEILSELMTSVNRDAGAIAWNLLSLYGFMHRRLIQANVEKDPGMVDEVYELLAGLRGAWEKAVCRAREVGLDGLANGAGTSLRG